MAKTVEFASSDSKRDIATVTFEPIEPLRAHEYVAEQLRRHIALGIVAVGGSLPSERELAQMFRVGRTTIQSALRMLEADHLIETKRGRGGGTFVIGPGRDRASHERLLLELRLSAAQIEDAVRFRRIIEEGAAAEAARVCGRPEISALRTLSAQMNDASDELRFHQLDTEFHIRIAEVSGIALLKDAVEQTRVALNQAIWAQPGSVAWQSSINNEHEAIVDAIEAADPVAAVRAMGEHLVHTEAGVRSLIASLG